MSKGGNPSTPSPKRSLRRHILRRVMFVLPLTFLILFAEQAGWFDRFGWQIMASGMNWLDDYQLVEYLRNRLVDKGLVRQKKECLLFIVRGNDPPNASRIDVMQKKSSVCPEVKGEMPKLFTVRVNRITRIITTDIGSPGLYHPTRGL